jgi:hypothetical protein
LRSDEIIFVLPQSKMALQSFLQHLSKVKAKQQEEIQKLKTWLNKSSKDDDEDFQGFITQNREQLENMERNLSYITWKIEMMNIILEDDEEEDEEEMNPNDYRVIEFYG